MLKDPLDPSESPYELLGLPTDVRAADVQAALARFMRDPKNRARVPQAMDAIKRLKNARDRAGIDILMYDFEVAVEEAGTGEDDRAWLADFRRVPEVDPAALPSDLHAEGLAACLDPIAPANMRASDLAAYDGLDQVRLDPPFDR